MSYPLPDSFIGAHPAIAGYTELARAARPNRTYFSRLASSGLTRIAAAG